MSFSISCQAPTRSQTHPRSEAYPRREAHTPATPLACGMGVATLDAHNRQLDTYFPKPLWQPPLETIENLIKMVGYTGGTRSYVLSPMQCRQVVEGAHRGKVTQMNMVDDNTRTMCEQAHLMKGQCVVLSFIAQPQEDPGPQTVPDAYLRLHLLSHRCIQPHGINLDRIFQVLPRVVWTSLGPVSVDEWPSVQLQHLLSGQPVHVYSVDKFPPMTRYVIPSGVRIADSARIRLGAYLGEGTTVMHEGFINFNAGCEGPNMIEGRIAAGVFVNRGTDLGGGSSTMGTLSGGGQLTLSIGKNCLIGANAGVGISLGDGCTIEAGLYITAGTKVLIQGHVVKARDLSGRDGLLFRRHSQTGRVEALLQENTHMLNEPLHKA